MLILGLFVVVSLAAFVFAVKVAAANTSNQNEMKKLDLEIYDLQLDPPNESVLKAHEPITLSFSYDYNYPNQPLRVWARVLDTTYDSTYQGACDDMEPGSGRVSRYLYLTEPGKIIDIDVIIKDQDYQLVTQFTLKVDYTFQKNEAMEALAEDGVGSTITATSLNNDSIEVLKPGTPVDVTLDYEVSCEKELSVWVIPVTDCNMTYDAATQIASGQGQITKSFIVAEPCELAEVQVVMKNCASRTVFSETIPVNFKYES